MSQTSPKVLASILYECEHAARDLIAQVERGELSADEHLFLKIGIEPQVWTGDE